MVGVRFISFFFLYYLFLLSFSFKKIPSPGIEPGAQTWKACMLPTTPQWTSIVKSKKYTSRQKKFGSLVSLVSIIKKDPTNRIRTSDLRKSIYNYSPPLYQLSYGRYPIKENRKVSKVDKKKSQKKLHRRESNPGHKRERLVCYQLHHNGRQ